MSAKAILNEREMRLAHEAAEWRLISLLFECPSQSWRDRLRALATEVADADLKRAVEDALKEADEGLFHYAFGPGGPAPAREATYHQTVELGFLISELQAYYNAFAYQPRTAEAPDHVSVETGFVAYLRLKEIFALARGEGEQAALAAEAAESFIREHLANMAQPLSASLEQSGIAYLSQAAAALFRRAGPAAPVTNFPILEDHEAKDQFACGSLDE